MIPGEIAGDEVVIDEGDKVKVTLRFRGREMAHQDIGVRVLERIRADMDPRPRSSDAADGKPPDGDGADAALTSSRQLRAVSLKGHHAYFTAPCAEIRHSF